MPKFFISYRRSDQEGRYLAHMIFRELRIRYGEHSAFLDVDSLSPGLSFSTKVNRALDQADVVLVIIGPAWLRILNERLSDASDWVRYEVAQSLKRSSLPVVPVCSLGVEIPRIDQLPDDLKDLGWRDGITLDPFQDFDSHVNRFLINLERVLESLKGEKERLAALRSELATLLTMRRESALRPLLDSLTSRVRRMEGSRSAPGPANVNTSRTGSGKATADDLPKVVSTWDLHRDRSEIERVVQLAVACNERVARWGNLPDGLMAGVGVLAGLWAGSFWIGVGVWAAFVVASNSVWEVVAMSNSHRLKNAVRSQPLTRTERAELADRLSRLKWHRRTEPYVRPIISSLRESRTMT